MAKLARFVSAAVLLASGTVAAQTTATVFVPGNTLGDFGNPSVDGNQPYVTGIVATGPGKVVISYLSGEVTDCCLDFSTGTRRDAVLLWNRPISPSRSIGNLRRHVVTHTDALIGIFVPRYRVEAPGFKAVDGAKNIARVGLLPSDLFFIGTAKTITVLEAGTLFLGINDDNAASNGGGYNVLITFTPVP